MESVTNLSNANSSGVPLFAPAKSTTTLIAGNIGFSGSMGNMMRPNLTSRTFTTEREDANGTDNADGEFTRFILATHYMKWKKIGNTVTHDADFTDGLVPVFYRMHKYLTSVGGTGADALNTLGANKAYLSLHTANMPAALWADDGSFAKEYIGIFGESDMDDISEYSDYSENLENSANPRTYNLKGQVVNDNGNLPPGIYIRNGKKIVIK